MADTKPAVNRSLAMVGVVHNSDRDVREKQVHFHKDREPCPHIVNPAPKT